MRHHPFTIIQAIVIINVVSWMRKRDMHILSAGILMYTSDLRFQVIHPDKSENWTLQIKSPQERDSGVYECQVSTEPKMSLNYTLNVIEKVYKEIEVEEEEEEEEEEEKEEKVVEEEEEVEVRGSFHTTVSIVKERESRTRNKFYAFNVENIRMDFC
ncbi:hypothetical protein M0804_005721 [Polistes exclamans]|nr:hypothetical protein M0804_005721 [Polistes exclamans]